MFIFVGRNWKTSIIRNNYSLIIERFRIRATEVDNGFQFYRIKKSIIRISSIQYIPINPKYQDRLFRLSCNYRNREKVKNVQNDGFTKKIKSMKNVVYFDVKISNQMSIFVDRDRKPSIIREKKFPDYREFQN